MLLGSIEIGAVTVGSGGRVLQIARGLIVLSGTAIAVDAVGVVVPREAVVGEEGLHVAVFEVAESDQRDGRNVGRAAGIVVRVAAVAEVVKRVVVVGLRAEYPEGADGSGGGTRAGSRVGSRQIERSGRHG